MINDQGRILHKICRLYGNGEEDRKDLYQEIVLQLWRAFPSYRREAQLSTWMYRVALNTAISLIRRQSNRVVQVGFENDLLNIAQTTVSPDIDERMQQFYRAVEQLTPIEKAIVFLYLDDNSYQQITEITGISLSNVGVKLNRIKGKLKRIVELTDK